MRSLLLCLSLLLFSFECISQDRVMTFSYWSEASPPFVFSNDKHSTDIYSGIIKDLGVLIAKQLDASPRFINLPVQRIESHLQSGEVDLDCVTNPIWKENPDNYYWSPALFQGADRFMVKATKQSELKKLSDLKGKSLGVYNGYTYHSKIMEMIEVGDLDAVKVSGIDHGIKLLLMDRIDALIDFDILLNYKIKNGYSDSLILADLYAERYDLFCAYSKETEFEKEQLDKVIGELIQQGEISSLLKQYN